MSTVKDDQFENHIPAEGVVDDTSTREGQLTSAKSSPRLSRHLSLQLQKYLSDVNYPARKSEILDYAIKRGADSELVDTLRKLQQKSYESVESLHDEMAAMS